MNEQIKIHDTSTGLVIERNITEEEKIQRELDEQAAQVEIEAGLAAAAAKAALLEKLGITEDEAKLLLS